MYPRPKHPTRTKPNLTQHHPTIPHNKNVISTTAITTTVTIRTLNQEKDEAEIEREQRAATTTSNTKDNKRSQKGKAEPNQIQPRPARPFPM
jgi:hypothetical protein